MKKFLFIILMFVQTILIYSSNVNMDSTIWKVVEYNNSFFNTIIQGEGNGIYRSSMNKIDTIQYNIAFDTDGDIYIYLIHSSGYCITSTTIKFVNIKISVINNSELIFKDEQLHFDYIAVSRDLAKYLKKHFWTNQIIKISIDAYAGRKSLETFYRGNYQFVIDCSKVPEY